MGGRRIESEKIRRRFARPADRIGEVPPLAAAVRNAHGLRRTRFSTGVLSSLISLSRGDGTVGTEGSAGTPDAPRFITREGCQYPFPAALVSSV